MFSVIMSTKITLFQNSNTLVGYQATAFGI